MKKIKWHSTTSVPVHAVHAGLMEGLNEWTKNQLKTYHDIQLHKHSHCKYVLGAPLWRIVHLCYTFLLPLQDAKAHPQSSLKKSNCFCWKSMYTFFFFQMINQPMAVLHLSSHVSAFRICRLLLLLDQNPHFFLLAHHPHSLVGINEYAAGILIHFAVTWHRCSFQSCHLTRQMWGF